MSHLRLLPPYVEPVAAPQGHQVLDWLALVCGGERLVDDLDAAALAPDDLTMPAHLAAAARLLDDVAERWFDEEEAIALRRALRWLGEDGFPQAVRGTHPETLAGGVAWAVGKANGCFRPVGPLGVTRIAESVGVDGSLSSHGQRVRRALLDPQDHERLGDRRRPRGVPDLLALGHPDLLTARTRAILIGLRDAARQERDSALPGSMQ